MGKRKSKKTKEKLIYAVIVLIVTILAALNVPGFDIIEAMLTGTEAVYTENIVNAEPIKKNTVSKNLNIKENISEKISIDKDNLNIFFFDVGQADCQLIICDGKTMLIDSGNSNDGKQVVRALQDLNIQKLDYVIGTHIHEDHIGSMHEVVKAFDIDKFYLPYNTTNTTVYYKKLLTEILEKDMQIEEANVGDKITLGEAVCEIMSVDNTEPDNENLASIVIQMQFGEMKYLFMGDAEKENELARKWEDIDVLKVGHHGSNTSSAQEFVNQVLPEIAIISVGEGNSYGLPKEQILNRYEKIQSKIYRTDKDGTIQLISDGKENIITKIDVSLDGE